MAKKQTIVSEITSALSAAAARVEKSMTPKPAAKNVAATPKAEPKTAKPAAKRTTAAKHSTTAPKKPAAKAKVEAVEVVAVPQAPAQIAENISVHDIVISREEIAKRAYYYWEARGRQPGDPAADWKRAEAELLREAAV